MRFVPIFIIMIIQLRLAISYKKTLVVKKVLKITIGGDSRGERTSTLPTRMRQGEISNLRWDDVDCTRGIFGMKVYELLASKAGSYGRGKGRVFTSRLANELKVQFLVRKFCEARDRAGVTEPCNQSAQSQLLPALSGSEWSS
jgi:integrase